MLILLPEFDADPGSGVTIRVEFLNSFLQYLKFLGYRAYLSILKEKETVTSVGTVCSPGNRLL